MRGAASSRANQHEKSGFSLGLGHFGGLHWAKTLLGTRCLRLGFRIKWPLLPNWWCSRPRSCRAYWA
jgi:hypothetical protein